MKTSMLATGTMALALSGCFGPGEPIVIPENWDEAAQTCLVAQSLALRAEDQRDRKAPMTFDEFSKTVQYPMIAATKGDTFRIESVTANPSNLDRLLDELAEKDFEGAVIECKMRFGLAGKNRKPTLPETKTEALFSCYSMSLFVMGAIQPSDPELGKYAEDLSALISRLKTTIETDADSVAAIRQSNPRKLGMDGAEQAFGQGAPKEYLEACDARFPAR